MRNFYFFVLLTSALVAGYAGLTFERRILLEAAGVAISVLFLGLDIRARGILQRCLDQLSALEPLVWRLAAVPGWTPHPPNGGWSVLTHKWIYRALLVLVGGASLAALVYRWARQ